MEAVPFTNEFGQTIQPGDDVGYVTVSRGRVRTHRGRYLGLLNGKVQISAQQKYTRWVYRETGKDIEADFWNNKYYSVYRNDRDRFKKDLEYKQAYRPRITTLQLNRVFKLG